MSAEAARGFLSRFAVLRMVSLLTLLCMLPLALLTYVTIHLAGQAVVKEVNARVSTTSTVTGVLVEQQMEGVAELTASFAGRPLLVKALAGGDAKHFDETAVNFHLKQLQMSRPGISGAFLTDAGCRLTQVEPFTPGIVGVDFSFRDWCSGVRSTGRPYVSEAYRTAITGHPLVVATAVIVRGTSGAELGKPLGILGAVYALDAIRSFSAEVAKVQGIGLMITDQRGTVLVGSAGKADARGLVSAASDARVRAALAGRSGVTRTSKADGGVLSGFASVQGIGWTVTAEVGARDALAGVERLRSTVLGVAGLLALVLLGGIGLMARTLRLRREAERTMAEREAHTMAILEAATDAFVSMDAGGAITAWNEQAEKVFGWTEAEALGRRLYDTIIPPHRREHHEQGLAHFLATGDGPTVHQRVDIVALHRDGHQFPAGLAIWPVRSGGTLSFNAFVHDITERKQAEVELAAARDQALEASKLKSEFLANMSHEIRTPMNGVLGMASLLLETDLRGDQREFAETVLASGESLLGILNDILDFSKIEAGRLDLECIDFDIRRLVEETASLLSLPAHQKGLELACSLPVDLPATVRGDPGRLRQILVNLVGNAVKFTGSGEVLLELILTEGDDGKVTARFRVVDTGIGISSIEQVALFKSFSQVDASTTRRYGGTGLGLAICRQLVELMGGEIGVTSEPGHGSTFWFTVTLERGRMALSGPPKASLAGLRMLIVDDNATNRTILARVLESWGIRSEQAAGAAEARGVIAANAAADSPFDALLLDLNMPGEDGFKLARSILANATLSPAPMVLLTSSGQRGEAGEARAAGISGYLTKPVRQSQLYDCLATVMDVAHPVAAAKRQVISPVRPVRKLASGRVLLAEDNAVNQRVAAAMLENLGFEVDIVSDGAAAVLAATAKPYTAILMDCQMPVLDGYQATGEIRRLQHGSRRTPIIAVTASAMNSDQQRCLAAGMDDYLSKPLSLKALAAMLARWGPDGADQAHVAGVQSVPDTEPGHRDARNLPVQDAEVVLGLG